MNGQCITGIELLLARGNSFGEMSLWQRSFCLLEVISYNE